MLIITPNHLHIDSIILQPTLSCGRQCIGCYLQRYQAANKEQADIITFISQVIMEEGISTYQLSVSIDKLNQLENKREYQLKVFSKLHELTRFHKSEHLHVDLVVHRVEDLIEYAEALGLDLEEIALTFDSINLSQLPPRDIASFEIIDNLRDYIPINLNHLTLGSAASMTRDLFKEWEDSIDQIYLLLQKPNLGQPFVERETLPALAEIKALSEQYPAIPDRCIGYCKENNCHAGTGFVTVWPDGSVTGCPYAGTSSPRALGPDILQNIRATLKTEDFKLCQLKNLL